MLHHSKVLAKLLKIASGMVIVLCGIYVFFILGPEAETKWWPVLDKLNITRIEPLTDDSSRVYAEFTKRRSCEYVGVSWYAGSRTGGFERVVIVLLRDARDTSNPTRPLGTQRAGPWQIGMPADAIAYSSFVDIYHKCHPFWITRTEWYP